MSKEINNDDSSKGNEYTSESLMEVLQVIEDPELKMSIVDLGLIYKIVVSDDLNITVDMTLTSPGCPVGPLIQSQIYYKLMDLENIDDVVVDIVWDPPWDPKTMASDEVKLMLGIF
jgi:metal-sulfur cluster biosynthetic enzyme|tara:strand:+ start:1140 stop:1487 length:348 start_codon:yes stop_codon:yes gene_type:complete